MDVESGGQEPPGRRVVAAPHVVPPPSVGAWCSRRVVGGGKMVLSRTEINRQERKRKRDAQSISLASLSSNPDKFTVRYEVIQNV